MASRPCIFLLALLVYVYTARADIPSYQHQALVDLYQSTNGPAWIEKSGWLSGSPCHNMWLGVECDYLNKTIKGVQLTGNMLVGNIPDSIGQLNDMKYLLLFNNSLTGTLPQSITNFTSMSTLDLHSNELQSPFPFGLWPMKALRSLAINQNDFSEKFPNGITQLKWLLQLSMDDNGFFGTLPTTIGKMTSLWSLFISNNSFEGNIPVEIGSLPQLEMVFLNSNQFSGNIPTLQNTVDGLLRNFNANNNLLTGPFPSWTCNLKYGDFSGNSLDCSSTPVCCNAPDLDTESIGDTNTDIFCDIC